MRTIEQIRAQLESELRRAELAEEIIRGRFHTWTNQEFVREDHRAVNAYRLAMQFAVRSLDEAIPETERIGLITE